MSKKAFVLSLFLVLAGIVGVGFFTWGLVNDGGSTDVPAASDPLNGSNGNDTGLENSQADGNTENTNNQPLGFYDNVYVIEESLPASTVSSRNVYILKPAENLESSLLKLANSLGMDNSLEVEESAEEIFISQNPGEIGESRIAVSMRDNNGYFSYWKIDDPKCAIQTEENVEECGGFDFVAEEASKEAVQIIEEISDFSANDLETEVFDSDTRIAVLVNAKIDGIRSDQLSWVFDFGKDGVIYNASGYLSDLQNVGSYQVLSAEESLERGNKDEWKRFILPGPPNSKVPPETLPDPDAFTEPEKSISFADPSWATFIEPEDNIYYILPSWRAGNDENVDTWLFLSLQEDDMKELNILD